MLGVRLFDILLCVCVLVTDAQMPALDDIPPVLLSALVLSQGL